MWYNEQFKDVVFEGDGQLEFEAKLMEEERTKHFPRVAEGTGKLENKVAIVTGAAGGQGELEAKLFASEGAKVVLVDLPEKEDELKRVVDHIAGDGGEAVYVCADVSVEDNWKDVIVPAAIDNYGKINVLMNNAGILSAGSILECDMDNFNRCMDVDLYGVLYGMRHCAPEMIKAGEGGSIINTSSISGCHYGQAAFAGYITAKAAVLGLSRSAACDLAEYGIRVNTIHPGHVLTPMTAVRPANRAKDANAAMLKRYGTSEEMARPALFLACDDSSFITGEDLYLDGGMTIALETNNNLYK
ncbi:MAG: SDR family oxidoreductase [Eggerthellaceae bacterium]|nr:SDR family oxidoreductase [Eggerthellaceae bacterium]